MLTNIIVFLIFLADLFFINVCINKFEVNKGSFTV